MLQYPAKQEKGRSKTNQDRCSQRSYFTQIDQALKPAINALFHLAKVLGPMSVKKMEKEYREIVFLRNLERVTGDFWI